MTQQEEVIARIKYELEVYSDLEKRLNELNEEELYEQYKMQEAYTIGAF